MYSMYDNSLVIRTIRGILWRAIVVKEKVRIRSPVKNEKKLELFCNFEVESENGEFDRIR